MHSRHSRAIATHGPTGGRQTFAAKTSEAIRVHPAKEPQASHSHCRSTSMDMRDGILLRSPFCHHVHHERPFYCMASISLTSHNGASALAKQSGWPTNSKLVPFYHLDLYNIATPTAIVAGTALMPEQPGRAERSFWLYEKELPADARRGVKLEMGQKQWLSPKGHPQEAYGMKCLATPYQQIDEIPKGHLTVPSLAIQPRRRYSQVNTRTVEATINGD